MLNSYSSFESFCLTFCTEQACIDALFTSRWPDGFRCPSCSSPHFYITRTRRLPLYECRSCSRQTSIITGTIMEGSSTSLTRWFQAMFLLTQPHSISSRRLSILIGVTYKTAWLIARKIRHALQQADAAQPLTDNVRIEAFHYGYDFYPDARQPLFIGSTLDSSNKPRQIKIKQPLPDHVDHQLRRIYKPGYMAFISEHIHKEGIPIIERSSKTCPAFTPIRRAVRTWLNEIFNGIGPKHLQAYLDEFCFRLNAQIRQVPVFGQLLQQCANNRTAIYKELTRRKAVLPTPWTAYGSKSKWKGKYLSVWNY